jgi:AbrB family looped-hinge helix DNA binding protein
MLALRRCAVQTRVTRRGQTVVPASIRKRHAIGAGDRLLWLDEGTTIRVVPLPDDALAALRGCGKGEGLLEKLLQERRAERDRDEQGLRPR